MNLDNTQLEDSPDNIDVDAKIIENALLRTGASFTSGGIIIKDPDWFYRHLSAQLHKLLVAEREIFVPLRGYEGLYEVSNLGNIKSIPRRTTKGGVMKQGKNSLGYRNISLSNGTSKTRLVHRLVAEAFLSNPENKRTVNHKDGNPSNNHIDNLEWATHSENERHSFQVLGKIHSQAKLTKEQIEEIKQLKGTKTVRAIAAIYNIHFTVVSKIHTGLRGQKSSDYRNRKKIAELQAQLTQERKQ